MKVKCQCNKSSIMISAEQRRLGDKNGGLRKLHAQPSFLISPTFRSAISRMSAQDRGFSRSAALLCRLSTSSPAIPALQADDDQVRRSIKCRNFGVRVVS